MEKTRTSIWAYFIDFINSFKDVKSSEQGREDLSDIPASYYEDRKVTKEQMEVLKESDAKLNGKKPKKPENKKEENSNFVRRNYKSGNTGGSQGKAASNSKEVKTAEKPDNELVI